MRHVKLIRTLLSLLVVVTLLTGTSQAALQSVGPNDPVSTLPTYYMDTNSLALVPCNDQDTPYCILGPPFDAASVPRSTITTTGPITDLNYPGEGFYYSADASMPIEGGADTARLTFVLEFAFLGGVAPDTGVTFLRTDLVQLNLGTAHANTSYRVTHPYGTFEFETDANGVSINGGNAIRFEDQPGTVFNYLPPFFKSAPNTGIGPFLRMASGAFIVDATTGKKYIGDAVTAGPVTGGTNGNIFRIDRLTGPGGALVAGATWQTPNFVLMGRVFTGQIPSPMTIDRVTYARDAAGTSQVDVFATALPAAALNISGTTGLASTPIPQDFPKTGKFFAHIPVVGALPTGVSITNSLDAPLIPYPVTLVDDVTISQSFYNPVTRNLTIKADSRDNLAPLPGLTVTAFGTTRTLDATGTVVVAVPANTIPPMTVTVNSSKLGSATAFVRVFTPPPAPIAVADAASIAPSTAVTIGVLFNDTTTATLDPATVRIVAPPLATQGTAIVNTATGAITFTAAAGFTGPATFTYDVKDNFGQVSNTATVTVTVTSAVLAIPTTTLANGSVNVAYSQTVIATGGIAPRTLSATGLPAGLTMSTAGVISGTPANLVGLVAFTTFPVTVTVTDSAAIPVTVTTSLNLRINQTAPAAPSVLAATAPAATQVVLTWTDNAINETGVQVQRATNAAFTIGLTSVTLTGTTLTTYTDNTVAAGTTYFYRVRSSNFVGGSAYNTAPAVTTPAAVFGITTTSLANGAVNAAYNQTVAATGGTGLLNWSATGLPTGLLMSATGVISGTPANLVAPLVAFTTFPVTVTVTDSAATPVTVSKILNIRINQTAPAAPTGLVATATLPTRVVLTWTDNANNETGVTIQRATNAAFTTALTTFTRGGTALTTFTDTTVVTGTTYFYRVRSVNFAAGSAYNVAPAVTTP